MLPQFIRFIAIDEDTQYQHLTFVETCTFVKIHQHTNTHMNMNLYTYKPGTQKIAILMQYKQDFVFCNLLLTVSKMEVKIMKKTRNSS